jgi:DNA-directed RNA polymerase specialized sigma24 family protein
MLTASSIMPFTGQRRDQAGHGQPRVRAHAHQVIEETGEHDEQTESDGPLERAVPLELPRHRPDPLCRRGRVARQPQRHRPGRLGPGERQAIMLAFYGGHTHQEIAVILGIALGTVKSQIRTGLHTLRDSMHAVH